MPRQARLDVPGALHHIMVRGINKSAIFDDDQDRQKFLERLGENIVKATRYTGTLLLKLRGDFRMIRLFSVHVSR